MSTKQPTSESPHSGLTFHPETEQSILDLEPLPFEVGTPFLRDPSFFSGDGWMSLVHSQSDRKLATVVVRCQPRGDIVTYVGNLEYFPEHHAVTRDALLADLSEYYDPDFVHGIAHVPGNAGIYLMSSIRSAFDNDSASIRSNMLRFTRCVTALMGYGQYEFDLSSASTAPKVLNEIDLILRLRSFPVEKTTYFGIIPPSTLSDIALQYPAYCAAVTRPRCHFMPHDYASEHDLTSAAIDLQLDLKAALESAVRPLFADLNGGEVAVFFWPPSTDDMDLVEFLGRIQLIWYPHWVRIDSQPKTVRLDDHGLEILHMSAGREINFVSKPMMDDDIDELVDVASELIGDGVCFLADEFDRWAQKLPPDRSDDYKMSADELLSAMQFLRRIIPKLAAHLG